MTQKSSHGGNIYQMARRLGIPESEVLDFSANINPVGLPDFIREAVISSIDGIVNYPDPDCTALREEISRHDRIPAEFISCGNGGADLLFRLAYGLRPGKVLLPVPAFVEYEEAMTAAGAEMVYYRMGEDLEIHEDIMDLMSEDIDLMIICNPSNPTGILTGRDLLAVILDRARELGIRLMIDECFLEICQGEEDFTMRGYLEKNPNLLILKSFTKMYAIPGLRLGYLLSADPDLIARVNRAGQAWPVSYTAQCVGIAALKRPDYREQVVEVTNRERAFMMEALSGLPVRLYPGAANYLFFRAEGMTDLDARLEKYGIMIRNCSNYVNLGDDYWRVAVRSHQENEKLISALKEILQERSGI